MKEMKVKAIKGNGTAKKTGEKILLYGLLLLLLALGLIALFSRETFSDAERRNLAARPDAPKAESLLTGKDWRFDSETETFLSDHMPFRRLLTGIANSTEAILGQGVWLECRPIDGAVIEPPVENADTMLSSLTRLRRFAESAGKECLFIIPPTAGSLLEEGGKWYADYGTEREALMELYTEADAIPLFDLFKESAEPMLYKTDHHWTLHGAYLAYAAFCERAGLTPVPLDSFTLTEYAPFYGTTLSRSGLLRCTSDTLCCAEPEYPVTYRIYGEDGIFDGYDCLIFPERAGTYDGYAVYMDGNHGHTEILSSAPGAKGTLLVCGDSFSLSLLPFLSAHYERIVMCDARYANLQTVAETAPEAETLLFIYSADDLCNDTSVKRIRFR